MPDNNINNTHSRYTEAYVSILGAYKDKIESSTEHKDELKNKFFNVIRVILFIVIIFFSLLVCASIGLLYAIVFMDCQSAQVVTGAVTALISSFVTMGVAVYALPKIIAEYLFDQKEDERMISVIQNIQKYEIDAVQQENKKSEDVNMLSTEKEREEQTIKDADFSMETSPNQSGTTPESGSDLLRQS